MKNDGRLRTEAARGARTGPPRVAFDARSLGTPVLRGWDRYTIGLVGGLAALGVRVTLFHRAGADLHAANVADLDCAVTAVPARSGLLWEQCAVPLALWRGKFDLYHAPAEHAVPLAAPCPTVLTLHSVTAHSFDDLVRRGMLPGSVMDYLGNDADPYLLTPANLYWHAQVARATWILAPSEFGRREVVAFLGRSPERVSTTPLAVAEEFREPPHSPERRAATRARLGVCRPYLLFVGGYEPHKNVPALLRVLVKVRRAIPGLALVTVGSTAVPPGLAAEAAAYGLRPGRDVVFLSGLREDLMDLYDDAALLVTLSWRETFCLPALEAMTRGTAVVASAWGAAPDVVGEGGIVVDPRDEDGAAAAVVALLRIADRAALAERARRAAARFSWERTAAQTLEVYHRLIEERR